MDIEEGLGNSIEYLKKLSSKEHVTQEEWYTASKILTKVYEEQKKLYIFMIMPFKDAQLTKNIERYIKEPLQADGHRVERVDDSIRASLIIGDIINSLRTADIIIAELTLDNLNVYYELGRAHEIEQNIIQICQQKQEDLPFDIRGIRTIDYEDSEEGYEILLKKIRNFLNIIQGQYRIV